MLDDDLITRLRKIQAEQIRKSDKNVSFSQVINQAIKNTLK